MMRGGSTDSCGDMSKIRVFIGPFAAEMNGEVLDGLLAGHRSLEIEKARDIETLRDLLAGQTVDVLITEVHRHSQSDYDTFFELKPDLIVLVLDLKGAESIVRIRDLGRNAFVRLVEAVWTARRGADDRKEHLQLVQSMDIERLAQAPAEPLTEEAYRTSAEHLAEVVRWLDLSLAARLARERRGESEAAIPGWTMNASQARALLGEEIADLDSDTLAAHRAGLEARIRTREAASRTAGRLPRLAHITQVFGLDEYETRFLWHVIAPELDGRYARIHGFLNDDLTRRRPTPTHLAEIIGEKPWAWPVRCWLAGSRRFAELGLIVPEAEPIPAALPAPEAGLAPAPELVSFLLADDDARPQYGAGTTLVLPEPDGAGVETMSKADRDLAIALAERLGVGEAVPVLSLHGGPDSVAWFERIALASGQTVVHAEIAGLEDQTAVGLRRAGEGWARVAALHGAILLVSSGGRGDLALSESLLSALVERLTERVRLLCLGPSVSAPSLVAGVSRSIWSLARPRLEIAGRSTLWHQRAAAWGLSLSAEEARRLGAAVRFEPEQIEAVMKACAGAGAPPSGGSHLKPISAAVRATARAEAPSAVRPLELTFGWNDIVLPDAVMAQLRVIPGHVRHAGRVLDDWNYKQRVPYGQGVAALFAGPSGCGKTMMAQILARDLDVECFQIDLSKTISKYIGETEKNLDRAFDAAERASAVLLFDEADALFGKRTEVKDAHDRYANVEVAYLLQRMEAYEGLAILTTNMKQNLDQAFLRRLRFVIDFPIPNPADRERIWRRAFPREAPLEEDVDMTFLARRLNLTGGHIQQIALRAAFAAAAADEERIAMHHVVEATRQELIKLGMLNAERDLVATTAQLRGVEEATA